MPDDSPNIFLNEKLIEVISEAGREPTRGQNLLDLFCCNKPSLGKACILFSFPVFRTTVLF